MRNFVPGTKLRGKEAFSKAHHRQSGAPLLAGTKESGSGDGTRGPGPEGGAHPPPESSFR